MGQAFIFCRANPPPMDLGHTGWGFQLQDATFFGGATEAFQGAAFPFNVPPGQNNDAWAEPFPTLDAIQAAFKGSAPDGHAPYNWWKSYEVAVPNYEAAEAQAQANRLRGWGLLGNNCLDHATDVIAAYGVPWQQVGGSPADGMPWKQSNMLPIGWFHAWNVAEYNL